MADRDSSGKWIKGHANNGAGRKPRIDEEDKNRLFDKAFPKSRKIAILNKLGAMAEKGDLGAIKLSLEYLYGKPIERKELTGENGGPIEIEAYEYHHAIAAIAPGSGDDSDASGEG
jgi:hypothetical protein